MSQKIDQMVTDRIIAELEKGVIPWRRPWTNHAAVNWVTQKPYQGINILLLPGSGEYATFNQVKEAGGYVKKGEKGSLIVFYKKLTGKNDSTKEEDEEDMEETKTRWYKQYSIVFDINTQCEGLESRRKEEHFHHDPITEAEAIVKGYAGCPPILYASGRAVYSPSKDRISVPPLEDYAKPEEYYSTLFHEMIHSTGHKTRLNRPGITLGAKFGSEVYAKEELIAEIGAAMLCAECGIDNQTIENSASYIGGWLRRLKNDPTLITQAAKLATRGAKFIRGMTTEKENPEEEPAA
ncbi:DUF1738 domain-containing protein [Brevibacillus formosus]|uniref:ArdC family protein n=1 Tax=Brevibacillus formosus TaxID=54913 RepID=UPI001CA483BD|nr:zincin-like metallopeptidase domain-containing protein [Brevibacillus formosus]MBW5471586.1 DUF1738 domain-containing protein [Brevibacillus formosus]